MKFSVKKAVVVLAATVASMGAFAQGFGDFDTDFDFREPSRNGRQGQVKKFELYPNQTMFRGQNTLKIKQMLKNEYPRRDFSRFDIKAVVLFAKSARGMGEAQLHVGMDSSYPEAIPGNRRDFRSSGNFNRVVLRAPHNAQGRKVQVDLQGRIKIDRIVVRAVKKRGHGGGGGMGQRIQFSEVDTFRAEKFVTLTNTIRVRQQDVKAIKLEALRNAVFVQSVVVYYGNGDVEHAMELEGRIREGREKTIKIGGRRGETIRKIEITATSASPFGSRGKIKVMIGK